MEPQDYAHLPLARRPHALCAGSSSRCARFNLLEHSALCSVLLLASSPSVQAELVPSILLKSDSETSYKGISETVGQAAGMLSVELSPSKHWVLGMALESAFERTTHQRDRSVSTYVSFSGEIDTESAYAVSLVHRSFLDSIKEWDFTELQASWHWRDAFSLKLAYSDDFYDHSTKSWNVEADWLKPLAESFYIKSTLGALILETAPIDGYQYAELGVGWRQGPLSAELSYGLNSADDDILFGYQIESLAWQLSASYQLW